MESEIELQPGKYIFIFDTFQKPVDRNHSMVQILGVSSL